MKFKSLQIIFIFLIANFFVGSGMAQETWILTLEESINIALGKSYNAKRLEESLTSSRMNLKAAEASFKSNGQLVFSSLPEFQEGIRQTPIPGGGFSFDREKFTNLQAEFFANQPIAATDGVFSIVGSMQRFDQTAINKVTVDGNTFEETTELTNYRPQLRIQFRQPMFTINRRKIGYQKARLNLEDTEQQYTRSQLDIIFNVTSNFYSLYRAQEQLSIDRDQVSQSENAYRIANLKQQAGLLPEVEALRLEIDLANARNTATNSEAALEESKDAFKLLIGIPITTNISAITELTYQPIQVSLEKAINEALNRRTELRSDEINVELNQINVEETDSQSEIVGELFLSYGILKVADKFKDAFNQFDNDRSVKFSLTLPIWDWGRNASQVQAAIANLNTTRLTQQNRIEQIKKEIRTVVRNLQSARLRAEITQRSEALAERSYRISLLIFENGDLSSQDLALEQNRLTQARISSLQAIIDHKQSLADLRRKTLWDFELNEPVRVIIPGQD